MQTLRSLDPFIDEQFRAEEECLRRHNYPGILVFRPVHERFAQSVAEYKKKARDLDARGEVRSFLAVEIEHRLEQRLEGHIRTRDRKMADYLLERM